MGQTILECQKCDGDRMWEVEYRWRLACAVSRVLSLCLAILLASCASTSAPKLEPPSASSFTASAFLNICKANHSNFDAMVRTAKASGWRSISSVEAGKKVPGVARYNKTVVGGLTASELAAKARKDKKKYGRTDEELFLSNASAPAPMVLQIKLFHNLTEGVATECKIYSTERPALSHIQNLQQAFVHQPIANHQGNDVYSLRWEFNIAGRHARINARKTRNTSRLMPWDGTYIAITDDPI